MKVYVISLQRAKERRQYMHAHLTSLGLDYEIVDAVDYQQMTPAAFAELTDAHAVSTNPYLTKGVQACALSHAKVCGLIANSDNRAALVLEDDAHLPATIKSMLALLEQEIGDEEVISLSYYTHFHDGVELSLCNSKKLIDASTLFFPVNLQDVGSAMAYVVSKAAATKIATVVVPVKVAADYWGAHYTSGAFTSFRCVHPIPVQPASFRSTLDYTATATSATRQILITLMGGVATIVRKYRIPVLYSYLIDRDKKRADKKYILRFVDTLPFNTKQP